MNKYMLFGNLYDSRSEAAIGLLLERYVPDFHIKEGETLHVSGGLRETAFDFVLPGAIVEWHPKLKLSRRRSYEYDLVSYKKKKQELVDRSIYKGRPLIVVSSFGGFYKKVLMIFGDSYSLPPLSSLRGKFREIISKAGKGRVIKKDLDLENLVRTKERSHRIKINFL